MDNFEFANRIVELRKQKGLSQKELGDMLGVSNKAVSKWENGESMPKLSTMLKLAEIMGIDGNELIGLQPGQNESPAVDKSELDRLKSENASLSSQLGKMNKKRKRFFIVALLLCAVGIVVCSIVAFGFNADEKINNKVTDAGYEGTKIEFADLTFVVPDEYQRYSLLSGKTADCYPDTKYADYYDKNGKKEKVVIKCNEFSDSVLLEVRRQKYFYVNTAVDKDNIKYELWILGEGWDRPKLEELINKYSLSNVKLLGFKENPYKYIKQGDLFVCSSKNEGFSLVIAEAMILGLPAISTNCSGPNELLNFGEYGYIVENNDKALYKGLKEIINDDKKLQYYKKKSSERVDFFNYKNRISDIERLFN